ncbi:MAG: cysteine--tRNA ligase [Sebaldella sp.]|nr:cysteine--tRNA ligase [Sebaldella sp.]
MKFYNTLTNKLEEFIPVEEKKVKMYVCGPTVYNYIHIGNARPIVVFDILARYFKYKGYKVEYVQNFTDIDDKMITKANDEGKSVNEIAARYIDAFLEDIKKLNVLEDVIRPKATDYITEMIITIESLIDKGFAYVLDGDVLFDVTRYKEYGELSNQKIDQLEIGSRIEANVNKKNPLDFVLWKNKKEGEPSWKAPWGEGRPGWHIECTAMSHKYFGETFDIHGGGQDLIFPHHENEIAQAKCAYGGNFANYWLHNGYIQIDGEKMSKSKGNFFLLRDILKEFDGSVVRWFLASTHYRKPINFSKEDLQSAETALEKIKGTILRAENFIIENNEKYDKILDESINVFVEKFDKALEDDLNTSLATSLIHEHLKDLNKFIDNYGKSAIIEKSLNAVNDRLVNVFGINLKKEDIGNLTSNLLDLFIYIRKEARTEKNFKLSDLVRDKLSELGVELKDNKDGSTSYTIKLKKE